MKVSLLSTDVMLRGFWGLFSHNLSSYSVSPVLELCGGELGEISSLEMLKRDDMLFEIVDEDDDEIPDELGELEIDEDDDTDDYYA